MLKIIGLRFDTFQKAKNNCVNVQAGLHLCGLQTSKDRFSRSEAHVVGVLQVLRFRPPDKSACGQLFSYFSTKTYVVSTQKNHLIATVLSSTQNTCLN